MELREKRRNFERGADNTFTEVSNGFGDDANAAFVFGRKKKWAEERAVDAIAESELRIAQAREKFEREIRVAIKHRAKQRVPVFGRIGRRRGSLRRSAHYLFFDPADLIAGLAEASADAGRSLLPGG